MNFTQSTSTTTSGKLEKYRIRFLDSLIRTPIYRSMLRSTTTFDLCIRIHLNHSIWCLLSGVNNNQVVHVTPHPRHRYGVWCLFPYQIPIQKKKNTPKSRPLPPMPSLSPAIGLPMHCQHAICASALAFRHGHTTSEPRELALAPASESCLLRIPATARRRPGVLRPGIWLCALWLAPADPLRGGGQFFCFFYT